MSKKQGKSLWDEIKDSAKKPFLAKKEKVKKAAPEERREASGASGGVACEGPSTSKQGHHDLQGSGNVGLSGSCSHGDAKTSGSSKEVDHDQGPKHGGASMCFPGNTKASVSSNEVHHDQGPKLVGASIRLHGDVEASCVRNQDHHDQGSAPTMTSTEGKANYARLCCLLVSVGSQVLRDTFDRIIPPSDLLRILKRNPAHSTLQWLRKEGIVSSVHWSKLYPATPSSVSSTGFSPALLIVLLRTICKLSPPPAGWDAPPHSEDTSREAGIARVNYFMNVVSGQLMEASVSDAVFSENWQQIRDTLVRLGGAGYEDVIDEMKNREMNSLDKEHFIELLKQWKDDEDTIKVKLKELESVMRSSGEEDASYPAQVIEGIRQHYRTCEERVLPVPWREDFSFHLNDIFTRLKILSKEKSRGTLTDEITNLTGIFRAHKECQKPRTVLIEGDPGMGKTTYCQKLAYDWATKQQEWDESFPEIEVLLLLRCHDIKSDIWEAIDDQLLPKDVDDEVRRSFFKFIRENQSKVLLVLDGLDEADFSIPEMYFNLVKGKVLPGCHIVLTSRHEAGRKVRRYCHTLWEIVGFTKSDAESFIRKYFKNMEHLPEKLLQELRTDWPEHRELIELTTNPLNTA